MGSLPKYDLYPSRYVIAAGGATTEERRHADLDLNTVANVSTALETALNDNERVYIVGTDIVMPNSSSVVVTSSVDIYADDLTIRVPDDAPEVAADNAPFRIQGSATELSQDGSSGFSKNSIQITLTADVSSDLSAGDYVQIRSSETANINRTGQYVKTELVRVESVSGAVVTLQRGLMFSYASPPTRIYRVEMLENVRLRNVGFVFRGTDPLNQPCMVQFINCRLPRLEHCWVSGNENATHGFRFSRCVRPLIDNVFCDSVDRTDIGYGVHIDGCEGAVINNFTSYRCRHPISAGQSWTGYPYSRGLTVTNAVSYNSIAAAYDTHACDDTTWINCTAYHGGGGLHLRGHTNYVDGLYVYGHNASDGQGFIGLTLGESSGTYELASDSGMGPGATKTYVRHFVVDEQNASDGIASKWLWGLVCDDPLVDSDIELTFRGAREAAILKGRNNHRSRLKVTMADNEGYRGTGYDIIRVENAHASADHYYAGVETGSHDCTFELAADWIPNTTPVVIYGGLNGGSTDNIHWKFSVLDSGLGGTADYITLNTGTHGTHYLDVWDIPSTGDVNDATSTATVKKISYTTLP